MEGGTLGGRQLCGAVAIVIAAVLIYAVRDIPRYIRTPGETAVSSRWEGAGITVELAGDEDHGGIYFLPRGAMVRDLLREAGVDGVAGFEETSLARVIHSGDRVIRDGARCRIAADGMSAAARVALGMPIDLNTATVEDLILIPGIGRKTAVKIVRFREEKGGVQEVASLKRMRCLGERRYEIIRGYLFVDRPSSS